MLIDFDHNEEWHPSLAARLEPLLSRTLEESLRRNPPEFSDEALPRVFKVADRSALLALTQQWVQEHSVVGYHGTRLTPAEAEDVRRLGLRPLESEQRRARLIRALGGHPQWPQVASRLDRVLDDLGRGKRAGGRVGQVHLTLSRAGLVGGFAHYLTHGSEFDQHAAHELLGDDGVALLAHDGDSLVVKAALAGADALAAANPYFGPEDMIARGEIPNLVRQLLEAWSYRLAMPTYDAAKRRANLGFELRQPLPPASILELQPWSAMADG